MARKRKRLLVGSARSEVDRLQTDVLNRKLGTAFTSREDLKVEIARQFDIPYQSKGSNRSMRAEDAGKMGGTMGGILVKELVRMSMETLSKNR
ncbi:Small, acid-soluble spore protein, alpha/beta type [Thermoactinomyces sp. DSM 45891]|uniref:small, acid-soluble spore protein, alpha/beta type n=1 Tax=Thermoactinomyces sp. DSM 45891 TaxID=1761907 RepID=UPI000915B25C|nr:small, acid-soluble spore protein, alpha/beta type [Thermoactinomyces sp. DSM 45891]SFX72527.1 Small, acid-soluble spore protein, alpha/beta type [Thermoactinomyces sp. DSM 45891]